jgi:hypothetical protein
VGTREGEVDFETSYFSIFGVLGDYYLNPEQGFHLQAALGLSSLRSGRGELSRATVASQHNASGLGAMIGVGNEWWVGKEWSIGVLGRLTYGALQAEDDGGAEWTHSILVPALLFSATYH